MSFESDTGGVVAVGGQRMRERTMADLGGLGDKAKDLANSDKGEKVTDSGIDKAEGAASSASGGKFDEKIESSGDAADKKVGN
jgi:hypothetical protein